MPEKTHLDLDKLEPEEREERVSGDCTAMVKVMGPGVEKWVEHDEALSIRRSFRPDDPFHFEAFLRWAEDNGFKFAISQGSRHLSVTVRHFGSGVHFSVSSVSGGWYAHDSNDRSAMVGNPGPEPQEYSTWAITKRCMVAGVAEVLRRRGLLRDGR